MRAPFTISVVTATRNRAALLGRCIESVAAQEYSAKEHIIIDGGSIDGSAQLIQRYAAQYSHIRSVSEPDNGLSEAFNKGIARANGDCLVMLGDDDWLEAGALQAVAAAFAEHPEAGIISGACNFVRDDGTLVRRQRALYTNRLQLAMFWNYWFRRVALPGPTSYISQRAIEAVGVFDETLKYAMDYDHWLRITARFPVVTIEDTLASFRQGEGSISYSYEREQRAETLQISKRYWPDFGPLTRLRIRLSYWFYNAVRRPWKQWRKGLKKSIRSGLKPGRAA